MVGPSKILTVSYGTFSCTLEGFDDSFELMKSIAEYFRDLAAEDRYFGAEPPAPDAEMLAQMAEAEVARRVEARTNGNTVALRAGAALTDERATQNTLPSPEPAAQPAASVAAVDTGSSQEPELAPSAAATSSQSNAALQGEVFPPEADEGSVAAKLRRIRAAVSGAPAATNFSEEAPTDDLAPTFFDQPTDPDQAFMAEADNLPHADGLDAAMGTEDGEMVEDVTEEVTPEAEVEVEVADETVEAEAEEAEAAEAETETEESVSAEAEVEAEAEEAEEAEADDDRVEAEDAAQDEDEASDDPEAAFEELEAAEAETAEADEDVAEADAAEEAAEDEVEAVAEESAEEAPEAEAASADDAAEQDDDIMSSVLSTEPEAADLEAPVEGGAAEEAPLDLQAFQLAGAETAEEEPQATAEAAEETAEEDDFEASLTAALSAADETPEEGNAEEAEDDFEASLTAALAEDGETAEAEEAEEEAEEPQPKRRVFSLRRPVVVKGSGTEADVQPEAASAEEEPQGDPFGDQAEDAERIFAQAEDHMDEPEGRNRRAAIAQLKAAVAATEAARSLGEDDAGAAAAEDPYRDDLSRVVRPRRRSPSDEGAATERPETPKTTEASPLKLVASQRVDDDDEAAQQVSAPAASVLPRRVSVREMERRQSEAEENPESASRSFSEYASSVGATGLSDLLEAAAAYTSFVEKRESFSRPQIIRKIKEMSGDEFSREDSLRSFGALLRQGRITKLRGGQFQVTQDTRFRPDGDDTDQAVGE